MTKGTIQRPGIPRSAVHGAKQAPSPTLTPDQAPPTAPGAKSSSSRKLEDKKNRSRLEGLRPQRAQRAQRPQRAHGPGAAAGAGHAGGAAEHDEDAGPQGLGAVEAGSAGDELHRRHSGEVEHLEEEDELEQQDEANETGGKGPDAIKRSQTGADTGGGDGFEGGEDPREAYERYMRGHVSADKERFDELRRRGARDDFNPERTPLDVEALGTTRATAHVVRLYEKWTLDGVGREEAVQRAASFLAGFKSAPNIRKLLAELESKPIRDVYPLEVLLKLIEERPELMPSVRAGSVIGNADDLRDGRRVLAGRPVPVSVPTDVRLKSFALLGGARPGYEFVPATEEGKYTLLVDTPGDWTFAVLAAPLQQLGRIQRETQEAIVEIFRVVVHAMGKKGEPLTPDAWRAQQEQGQDEGDDGDDRDDGDDDHVDDAQDVDRPKVGRELARELPIASHLAVQIRAQLETIRRDDAAPGAPATATTYSWDARFYKPGAPVQEPLLHLVVQRASAFDPAWSRAREALAQKQREHEPSRAPVTQEDFTAALRRARVR